MALKSAFAAACCIGLLASVGPVMADEYHAGEFLGLNLSRAVLSPKRLGPETQFAPVAIEAKTDGVSDSRAAVESPVEPGTAARKVRTVRVGANKPRAPARAKLARRHSNPLDAQASDTRIQKWPCKSGGICGWQR